MVAATEFSAPPACNAALACGSVLGKTWIPKMGDSPTSPWADDFFNFGYVPVVDEKLGDLAGIAEEEDWTYQHTPSEHPFPVLYNYIRFSYRRIAEENKIAFEFGVFGPVDLAHTTGTNGGEDFVWATFGAGRERHLTSGMRRRTSSKKFNKKVTWTEPFGPPVERLSLRPEFRNLLK
jgi:hypothetical protein